MASLFRDRSSLGHSKRDSITTTASSRFTGDVVTAAASPLPSPFGDLTPSLSAADLHDTAYEIFVTALGNRVPIHRVTIDNNSSVDATFIQERAFMMIRMNGDGSDYRSWEAVSYVPEDDDDEFDDLNEDEYDDSDADDDQDDYDDEEDAFDVHAHSDDGDDDDNPGVELDPVDFPSDEAYARALQDAEDRGC